METIAQAEISVGMSVEMADPVPVSSFQCLKSWVLPAIVLKYWPVVTVQRWRSISVDHVAIVGPHNPLSATGQGADQ